MEHEKGRALVGESGLMEQAVRRGVFGVLRARLRSIITGGRVVYPPGLSQGRITKLVALGTLGRELSTVRW